MSLLKSLQEKSGRGLSSAVGSDPQVANLSKSISVSSLADITGPSSPPEVAPKWPDVTSPQTVASDTNGTVFEETNTAKFAATSAGNGICGIFWDYENCRPPSGMAGYAVVEHLRRTVHHFGQITLFKAYLQIDQNASLSLRSELQSSGVSLTDTPHNGAKDAADKMILIDMMAFALDNPAPATIVLISGDRDFVYALSTLRNRRYNIVLIVPNRGANIILRSQANTVLEWRYDVLQTDIALFDKKPSPSGSVQPASASSQVSEKEKPQIDDRPASSVGKMRLTQSQSMSSLTDEFARPNSAARKKESAVKETPLTVSVSKPYLTDEDERLLFSPQAPGFFDLLVEVIERCRMDGNQRPKRKRVIEELLRRNPLICQRNGLHSCDDYIELAVKQGIVSVGGDKKHGWVTMNDDFVTKF